MVGTDELLAKSVVSINGVDFILRLKIKKGCETFQFESAGVSQ